MDFPQVLCVGKRSDPLNRRKMIEVVIVGGIKNTGF